MSLGAIIQVFALISSAASMVICFFALRRIRRLAAEERSKAEVERTRLANSPYALYDATGVVEARARTQAAIDEERRQVAREAAIRQATIDYGRGGIAQIRESMEQSSRSFDEAFETLRRAIRVPETPRGSQPRSLSSWTTTTTTTTVQPTQAAEAPPPKTEAPTEAPKARTAWDRLGDDE